MRLATNKFLPSEASSAEERLENIEQYLSQFTGVVLEAMRNKLNFQDQFDAEVKQVEVRGSGSYILATGRSQALGGIVLRSSQDSSYPEGYNINVEGSTVKLTVNMSNDIPTLLTVVIMYS